MNLLSIYSCFNVAEPAESIESFGSGHINDTYRVTVKGYDTPRYLLQRVNLSVFPKIDHLSENIRRISQFLNEKGGDRGFQTMVPIGSKYGNDWALTAKGECWRLFTFIPNSVSVDLVESENQAQEAGKAYGWFIATLNTFPATSLHSVIPNFHNLDVRLNQLHAAIDADAVGRLSICRNEVAFYLSRSSELMELHACIGSSDIPLRVTHNDTKVNNVLFTKEGKALSVIDLDTVMPGAVHYDFGDAIRTNAAMAMEDETDLSKVGIDLSLFSAFSKGFLAETKQLLTPTEIHYLPMAPRFMAYIMGIRFLADYLRGDTYYKVKHPNHNIDRARNQMALIEDMERKSADMKAIIEG